MAELVRKIPNLLWLDGICSLSIQANSKIMMICRRELKIKERLDKKSSWHYWLNTYKYGTVEGELLPYHFNTRNGCRN